MLKILVFILTLLLSALNAQTQWNLNQCLDYIVKNHPDIQQTALDTKKINAKILESKGSLLPDLNAGINHNYSLGSTINPSTNAREALNVMNDRFYINSNIEIFNWRNFLNIQLSNLEKESFKYRLEARKNELKLLFIQQYFIYQNAKAWTNVLHNQLSGIDEQIQRTEKEVEIGIRPKSDIYDIKANLGIIKESWLSARNSEDLAKIELLKTLNIRSDSIDFIESEKIHAQIDILDLETYVQNHAIIKKLDKELLISDKNIESIKSQRLPTISGQFQWSSFYSQVLNTKNATTDFGKQIDQNRNIFMGIGLNIPIFNRFRIKTQTTLAEAEKEYITIEKQKTENELFSELNKIVSSYRNAIEKYELVQANYENQKLSFERSVEKYNEGLMNAYTFFIVRNNWQNANFNLIQSRNHVRMQEELLKVFVGE